MNSLLTPVNPVSPPAPWQGGKRALAPTIIKRIAEVEHSTYAEPFIGMGGVFFRRTFRPQGEVINDYNGEVINLFRMLQRHYGAFMDFMKYQLTSRREFERLSKTDATQLTDMERAARFIYLQRTAFGGKVAGQCYGTRRDKPSGFDYSKIVPALEDIYERLTGVVIENLDWAEFIRIYDGPGTLFYLDPPYWGNENDYGKDCFTQERFVEMAEMIGAMEGKAILSLNDVPGVRVVFSAFRMETVELNYSIGQMAGGPKKVSEVIIYNFDKPELPLFG
jgi:DNA adenine methylase